MVHVVVNLVEHSPHSHIAYTCSGEIDRSKGGTEIEGLVFACKIALTTGEVNNVVLVNHFYIIVIKSFPVLVGDGFLTVTQRKSRYSRRIGMPGDVTVRDTDGYPYGTSVGIDGITGLFVIYRSISFACYLHIPYLVGIRNGECLSVAAITVLFHQVGHYLYRFAC